MQARRRRLLGIMLVAVTAACLGSHRSAGAQASPGGNSAQEEGRGGFPGGQMVRGVVTGVSPDGLTMKSERGDVYKIVTTNNTRLMKDRQPVKMADIKPGDGVGAAGVMDAPNKTVHAAFVMVMDAEQVKKAQEDLGKTYIAGKVTAIDDLKLTVQRPDGVSQVIQVDEGTSFRRGRRRDVAGMGGAFGDTSAGAIGQPAGSPSGAESITLADIKVGDVVAGKGALKNGVFVPTELGVMDPAAGGRGRRRGGAAGGDAAGAASPSAGPQP